MATHILRPEVPPSNWSLCFRSSSPNLLVILPLWERLEPLLALFVQCLSASSILPMVRLTRSFSSWLHSSCRPMPKSSLASLVLLLISLMSGSPSSAGAKPRSSHLSSVLSIYPSFFHPSVEFLCALDARPGYYLYVRFPKSPLGLYHLEMFHDFRLHNFLEGNVLVRDGQCF